MPLRRKPRQCGITRSEQPQFSRRQKSMMTPLAPRVIDTRYLHVFSWIYVIMESIHNLGDT